MVLFQRGTLKGIPFFKLYPIINLDSFNKIEKILSLGIEWIQVREKERKESEIFEELKKVKDIFKKFNAKLILNDYVEIAKKLGVDGVHIGQEDLKPEEARKILGENKIIGISCYERNEIEEAMVNPFVDYVSVGPVFETPFKEKKPLGLEILREYSKRGKPLVAIGGINSSNLFSVLETGVHKVSFIRFLNEIL